eukprot:TRINITY_DN97597_c0_g2_i1.p1 TRINITY_DN97597_c0_g2~~TRINITY_DN97597_c0_g2_i1.p1  ORF type:complete len:270 (+),score=20.00 TRINITY_DN97597_c0_g2_i1:87-896(+)
MKQFQNANAIPQQQHLNLDSKVTANHDGTSAFSVKTTATIASSSTTSTVSIPLQSPCAWNAHILEDRLSKRLNEDEQMRLVANREYIRLKLREDNGLPLLCFKFSEACRNFFLLHCSASEDEQLGGITLGKYVKTFSFSGVAVRIASFLRRYQADVEDVEVIFTAILCYFHDMESDSLVRLLAQMVIWYDMNNVLVFLAFIAHSYFTDSQIPLRYWSEYLASGTTATGANVNKCTRNLLKMRKYKLNVDSDTFRSARDMLLSLDETCCC